MRCDEPFIGPLSLTHTLVLAHLHAHFSIFAFCPTERSTKANRDLQLALWSRPACGTHVYASYCAMHPKVDHIDEIVCLCLVQCFVMCGIIDEPDDAQSDQTVCRVCVALCTNITNQSLARLLCLVFGICGLVLCKDVPQLRPFRVCTVQQLDKCPVYGGN